MAITLYDLTVPVFLRGLGILSGLLEKGRLHAVDRQIPEMEMVNARLAPDMLTLAGQIQRASDTAKFAAVRIGGVENLPFADEEASFAELQDRLARTRAFLEAVPPGAIDATAGQTITVTIGRGSTPVAIVPADYALKFALPNFFFHVATAYDILRHRGVALGKRDFIGPLS